MKFRPGFRAFIASAHEVYRESNGGTERKLSKLYEAWKGQSHLLQRGYRNAVLCRLTPKLFIACARSFVSVFAILDFLVSLCKLPICLVYIYLQIICMNFGQ